MLDIRAGCGAEEGKGQSKITAGSALPCSPLTPPTGETASLPSPGSPQLFQLVL